MAIVPPGADPRESGTAVLPGQPPGAADTASPASKPHGLLRRGWEVFAENRLALASLVVIIFIVLFCFVGPAYLSHRSGAHQPDLDAVPAERSAPARLRQPRLRPGSAG